MSLVLAHALVHALEATAPSALTGTERDRLKLQLDQACASLSGTDIQFLSALHPECVELQQVNFKQR